MSTLKRILLAATAAAMLAATFVESLPAAEMKHDMGAMAAQSGDPAAAGYQAAMDKMHREMMAMKYTGDADVDFVRGMIPHHQAAIDMAKVVLDHGKDPEIRKLAQDVIKAQSKEIDEMENWLTKHKAK
ncbi:DUF305 domain-containing protein [Mesorhizobium sp. SP-1A]|uniref:CopM family metallochaperone n=1 Tax=Mesorhizobium sp. SP-1A TaxID=3077840 RepID=UPI0028F7457F|nr:DUF305 domain-containing protein [Mesorhizobium sp. SP-1A]